MSRLVPGPGPGPDNAALSVPAAVEGIFGKFGQQPGDRAAAWLRFGQRQLHQGISRLWLIHGDLTTIRGRVYELHNRYLGG